MIAFILTLHYYTNHLVLKNLSTAADDYDGNSYRRMETDFHYYHSIVIDHCDDFSGSATYDDGDGRRDHCVHDYCDDDYYFSSYWKSDARASYSDDHLRCYYFHRPDYANHVQATSLSIDWWIKGSCVHSDHS